MQAFSSAIFSCSFATVDKT